MTKIVNQVRKEKEATVELPDIQKTEPEYQIPINEVGIENIILPIKILQKNDELQDTVAKIKTTIYLEGNQKGTHMSRFPLILQKYQNKLLNKKVLINLAEDICDKLESHKCNIEFSFIYFIEKTSPITRNKGLIDIKCKFYLEYNSVDKNTDFMIKVVTPVISCCPCSKEISVHNAHNQRADISIKISNNSDEYIWIEDLVEISDSCASSNIYPVLKREDEKYVTEEMYKNSYFVEDIARKVENVLENLYYNEHWKIKVVSYETIHRHNAIAKIIKRG